MNWDALGAIGELVGAVTGVATLVFLVVQIRKNTKVMDESNRLERAAAMDRHTDSIGRWRSLFVENRDLAKLWIAASNNEKPDNIDQLRLDNLWIDFFNIQRSNYLRARIVGDLGLMRQTALSIAADVSGSNVQCEQWEVGRQWHALASSDFVDAVDI